MKGDNCSFLHEDIETLKPLCKRVKEHGQCDRGDKCLYRHRQLPEDEIGDMSPNRNKGFSDKVCPQFERGFCLKGRECRFLINHVAAIR